MSAQNVDSRIIDVNGFGGNDDGLEIRESALSAMSVYEAKGLDGELYVASLFTQALANNGQINFRLMSQAARKIKFNVEAQNNRVRMMIYQASVFALNGAVLLAAPPNFVGDANANAAGNLNANFVWNGPTITTVGTLRFDGLVGAVMDYLFTIQPRIEYLVNFTNFSGATNAIGINIGTFV
jgi:hypothetical protein